MAKENPKVSVLIPVYNAEKYVKESIESILNQNFSDFELILLDDASTDNSDAIVKKIVDPRIRYYKNEKNMGISGSRNKLLDLAKGEYLAIMDCDDISVKNRLKLQVEYMDKHPDVVMLSGWKELFSKAITKSLKEKVKKFITNLGWFWCQPEFPNLKDMLKGNPMVHSAMMLRAQDMTKYNIRYNEKYSPAEDYDIVKQALFLGLKVANLQRVLLKYHLHGNNFSISKKEKMKLVDRKVKDEVAEFLGVPPSKYPYLLVIIAKLRWKYFFIGKNNDN